MLPGILFGLFLVATVGGMLYAGVRPAAAIWRGDANRLPRLGRITVTARGYLAFLLWFVPVVVGLLLIGSAIVADMLSGSRSTAAAIPAYVGFVLMLVGAPFIVLQWIVSALARPTFLIPPPYRGQLGSIAERRERRRRLRSGLPPTDHVVEILDVRPLEADDFEPYLMVRCTEPECDWFEFADDKLIGPSAEDQLRSKAAKHSTTVAPGFHRPLG